MGVSPERNNDWTGGGHSRGARDPDLAALLSSRSGMPRGQESYLTYDISPLPKDQFSFGTSTKLMRTSSRRKAGPAASLSAIVR